MSTGKNFNLYLMDGDVTGRIKCTMSNWTGLAFKIPRADLNKCKDRQDLKYSGVYFLFGKTDTDEDAVYIGQAGIRKNGEGVLFRVNEHLKDDFYFSDVVMLTTQTNSFGPTEISYLENKFTNMAQDADRYVVRNGNDPNPGNVTEEKESELEDFIEYSQMVLGVLGYKVFVPLVRSDVGLAIHSENELELYLKRRVGKPGKTIEARCKRTNEGFVVLKGSMVSDNIADATPQVIKDLRNTCCANGDIIDGVLTKSYLFNSPSYAASFVIGNNVNGRSEWKTSKDLTLKEHEEMSDR